MGVVEKRDDRLETQRVEPGDEPRIALEGGLVELPSAGFDAAPRDREPERVRTERGGRRRVLLVTLPGPRGAPAWTAAGLPGRLPVGPVARVVPLDLVVRYRDAEVARTIRERETGGRAQEPWNSTTTTFRSPSRR
jgi:hypothetical protein